MEYKAEKPARKSGRNEPGLPRRNDGARCSSLFKTEFLVLAFHPNFVAAIIGLQFVHLGIREVRSITGMEGIYLAAFLLACK